MAHADRILLYTFQAGNTDVNEHLQQPPQDLTEKLMKGISVFHLFLGGGLSDFLNM